MCDVFDEVKRLLKQDGTCWINIGDSYNGSGGNHKPWHKNDKGFQGEIGDRCGGKTIRIDNLKPKDIIGIPWMLAFALRDRGWYLRQDIIWAKPNPLPEPVKDRCVKSHEYVFLLSKDKKYYFDYKAIQEPAKYPNDDRGSRKDSRRGSNMNAMSGKTGVFRNKRDVWNVTTKPNKEAHFATFPKDLIEPMIRAGSKEGGIVLDPFMGSGTTAIVSKSLGRHYIGCELNKDYIKIADKQLNSV